MSASVVIAQVPEDSAVGFACYGANRDFFFYRGEAILSGPYETGKTMTGLNKLHLLLSIYGGARALIVRKTYASLITSGVVTYEKKVLPFPPGHKKCPVKVFGGSKPEWYDYPNKSKLLLGGMDNPDKFLSAEFDFIYYIQAEEGTLDEWEKLTGRASGRAGNAPYSQTFGDVNPEAETHWILHRAGLRVFYSHHEDNPTLYDQATGQITERGINTMKILDALTGLRYKRGRLGLWVGAEGQVYETYDPSVHLINRFDIPADWRRFRSIDFGFVHPFVCQWWAEDHDGRMYRYRELYVTGHLVEDLAAAINVLSEGEAIEYTVTDHDAEDRATLERYGIYSIPAKKTVLEGIQAVAERLRVQNDGKPRIFFLRDSIESPDPALVEKHRPTCTEEEFPLYVWAKTPQAVLKEIPVKDYDHGMDCTRYAVMSLADYDPDGGVH